MIPGRRDGWLGLRLAVLATILSPSATTGADASTLRDRAREALVARIAAALELSEDKTREVNAVIRGADERQLALMRDRQALEAELRHALQQTPVDLTQLRTLVAEGNTIDQKLALVPENTFHVLQTILTVEQQARLLLFRRDLQAEVQRVLQHGLVGERRRHGASAAPPEGRPR
jgi:hypothetical protein